MTAKPRFWITYAWMDDETGDFSYLAEQLTSAGVETIYDKKALVRGQRLWDQIAKQITDGPLDGWGYLITPNSLGSEACREELAYALNRALNAKGRDFPIIGLIHDVQIEDLPPALKVRLCVNLRSPDWIEEVKSGLQQRPPQLQEQPQTQFVWRRHDNFGGQQGITAIEIRPRFGEIMYWRLVVPSSASVANWGYGPANGGALVGIQIGAVEGTMTINSVPARFFGAADRLSSGTSAYIVFSGRLPSFVGFGLASQTFAPPQSIEVMQLDEPK